MEMVILVTGQVVCEAAPAEDIEATTPSEASANAPVTNLVRPLRIREGLSPAHVGQVLAER